MIRRDRRRLIGGLALAAQAAWAEMPAQVTAQVPPLSAGEPGPGPAPGWHHQTLPKVARSNDFALVDDPTGRVLHIRSQASASSWAVALDLDPTRLPLLQWRWKVSRALNGSDLRSRAGDDYAARLYVLFALPDERLSLADRLRIEAARLLSGADLPSAAICYVWGRAQPAGSSGWNPYTDRVRMVVQDSGDAQAMQWRSPVRDIPRDWAEAFGGPVPRISGLALSADTDNTGEQVEAWFGDPVFSARR